MESQLKMQAEGMPYVFFIGFQNQSKMPIVYRLGDILCLPSKGPGETWGLSVNEAMAAGLPVLVSDKVGCAVDLVLSEETGYVFQSTSLADLKNILKQLDKNQLRAMGTKANKHISTWNFDNQVHAIINQLNG